MSLATTNFEAGLVELAIQNGSVFSSQRPVAPTYALLLGLDPEMSNNIIAGVKDVPTYGALSDAEIRSGIIRSFVGNNTTLGQDTFRTSGVNNQIGTISTFTPQEVLSDISVRTTYYNDGGQFINVARMVEGQGAGWAANMSYEQVLAAQMVQEYITNRNKALFVTGASKMPADGVFGSLRAMISDGLSIANRGGIGTDEATNYGTYGGQTRTTAGATLASQYLWAPGTGSTGSFTPAAFSESIAARAALLGYGAGAGKLVAPMSLGRFAAFEFALRSSNGGSGYGMLRVDESLKTIVNGGRAIEAFGVTFYPDPNITATTTFQLLIDLGTPGMPNVIARTAMQKSQIQHIPAANLYAADRLRWAFPDQCIVRNPKSCVLVEGLTAL